MTARLVCGHGSAGRVGPAECVISPIVCLKRPSPADARWSCRRPASCSRPSRSCGLSASRISRRSSMASTPLPRLAPQTSMWSARLTVCLNSRRAMPRCRCSPLPSTAASCRSRRACRLPGSSRRPRGRSRQPPLPRPRGAPIVDAENGRPDGGICFFQTYFFNIRELAPAKQHQSLSVRGPTQIGPSSVADRRSSRFPPLSAFENVGGDVQRCPTGTLRGTTDRLASRRRVWWHTVVSAAFNSIVPD
jgi:hypothetical protein